MNTNPALKILDNNLSQNLRFTFERRKSQFSREILIFKAIRNAGKWSLRVDRGEKRKREGREGGWTRCAKHSVMKVGRFAGRSGEKQRK